MPLLVPIIVTAVISAASVFAGGLVAVIDDDTARTTNRPPTFQVDVQAADNPAHNARTEIGYMNVTTVGILLGDNQQSVGMYSTNGIRFGKSLGLGIGLGLESYDDITAIPICFDMRVNLLPSKTSPYLLMQTGYTREAGTGVAGEEGVGFMVRLGGGIRLEGKGPWGAVIEGGYRLQSWSGNRSARESLNMVSLSFGLAYW